MGFNSGFKGLMTNWKIANFAVSLPTSIRAGRPGARFSVGERDFSRLKIPQMLWSPDSSLFNWHRVFFLQVEQMGRAVELSFPSSAETKKGWRYTSTSSPARNGVDSVCLHNCALQRSWLDVPTFATRRLHACHHARAPSGGRWNCGREMSGNFCLNSDFHLTFTCRKATTWDRRLYFPFEGRRAEDFFAQKIRRLRPCVNPRTWVPKASTLPLDHRSRCVDSDIFTCFVQVKIL